MTDAEKLIDFTQRIVRTKSLSGGESEVVQIMAKEMEKLGYDRVFVDETGSLVGIVDGREPGPTLLMDGHCDTVEANPADWKLDPWSGALVGDRLYGRGSADMKGSLAAMIYAAAAADRKKMRGRVAVSATVSEEVAEGAALAKVIAEVKPDFVVVGEATNLNLNRGGRGRAEIHLTSIGKSAHSSSPQAGHCAVKDMLDLVATIASRKEPQDPLLGPGTMVLTDIISQPYPGYSVVPYRCHVTYDRRLLAGESKESILAELAGLKGKPGSEFKIALAPMEEKTYKGHVFRGDKLFPAWVLSEDHPLVQAAFSGLKKAGLSPRIGAYRFCTNATCSAGLLGIPTVGFGLAREEDAHIADETIGLDDLVVARRGYEGIIASVCSSLAKD
jgi:putative selenium metabolism hydrolase